MVGRGRSPPLVLLLLPDLRLFPSEVVIVFLRRRPLLCRMPLAMGPAAASSSFHRVLWWSSGVSSHFPVRPTSGVFDRFSSLTLLFHGTMAMRRRWKEGRGGRGTPVGHRLPPHAARTVLHGKGGMQEESVVLLFRLQRPQYVLLLLFLPRSLCQTHFLDPSFHALACGGFQGGVGRGGHRHAAVWMGQWEVTARNADEPPKGGGRRGR